MQTNSGLYSQKNEYRSLENSEVSFHSFQSQKRVEIQVKIEETNRVKLFIANACQTSGTRNINESHLFNKCCISALKQKHVDFGQQSEYT